MARQHLSTLCLLHAGLDRLLKSDEGLALLLYSLSDVAGALLDKAQATCDKVLVEGKLARLLTLLHEC